MSADAKVYQENNLWYGVHDGPCSPGSMPHNQGEYSLTFLMDELEQCTGTLRWEMFQYPNGLGLRGFVV